MILKNIPPSLTTTVQLYVRGTNNAIGSAVGSPITGTSSGTTYTYSLGAYVTGDYWCVLTGVSDPVGSAFPVRDDVAYPWSTWEQVEQIEAIASQSGPVASTGTITTPIVIGDDYLAANGRAFQWTIAALTGYAVGTATCKFGGAYKTNTWLVTGTIADVGSGNWTLSFDLPKTATADLEEGYYSWSVEVISASGTEITRVRSGRNVLLVDKQT